MRDHLWGLICVRRARRDTISGEGRMPRCSDGPTPGCLGPWEETTPGCLGGNYPRPVVPQVHVPQVPRYPARNWSMIPKRNQKGSQRHRTFLCQKTSKSSEFILQNISRTTSDEGQRFLAKSVSSVKRFLRQRVSNVWVCWGGLLSARLQIVNERTRRTEQLSPNSRTEQQRRFDRVVRRCVVLYFSPLCTTVCNYL